MLSSLTLKTEHLTSNKTGNHSPDITKLIGFWEKETGITKRYGGDLHKSKQSRETIKQSK